MSIPSLSLIARHADRAADRIWDRLYATTDANLRRLLCLFHTDHIGDPVIHALDQDRLDHHGLSPFSGSVSCPSKAILRVLVPLPASHAAGWDDPP